LLEDEHGVVDVHASLGSNDRFSLEALDEVRDGRRRFFFKLLVKGF
jgi:hypothetical protein